MKKNYPILSLCFLVALIVVSFFSEVIFLQDAYRTDSHSILLGISEKHWAGTDSLGRDLLQRLFVATQISVVISVGAAFLSVMLGAIMGVLAGFAPTQLDHWIMRLVDVLASLPDLLVYILLGLFLGRSPVGLIVAISLLSWAGVARLVRGACLTLKGSEFLVAARALGIPYLRQMVFHVWPHLRSIVLAAFLFKVPQILSVEATLSFIGLGLAPPQASYGSLAREGFEGFLFYPHLAIFPFLFIFLTVLSLYNVARGLQRV